MTEDAVPLDRSMDGSPSGIAQVSPLVRRVVASNAGPFTFTGTCTYLVGHHEVVAIDPGPADPVHLERLLQALEGRTLAAILVTHTHRDHSPGAVALKAATGAPVFGPPPIASRDGGAALDRPALDAAHDRTYQPDRILADGDTVGCGRIELQALATPGHTANHLAFVLPDETALFSGDHVMAWSTTVVAPPDGAMDSYLASLTKLLGRPDRIYWPGHGGPVREPQRFVRALLHHRRQREQAILMRLAAGDRTPETIVRGIYQGLAPSLRGAAALSVLAHLEDLRRRDLVRSDGQGLQAVWQPAGQLSAS